MKQGLAKAATRSINRAEIIDRNFIQFVENWTGPGADRDGPALGTMDLGREALLGIFTAQMESRHLDLVAREMRARNEGFYTIGSSGHENNAVVGWQTRCTDPAFLHYRSGGFMMARYARAGRDDGVRQTALSLAACVDDTASGGRHKVWGNRDLWVLPQTSTIASHLPKAVGTAIALQQARGLGFETPVPADSVVVCSFGDASCNHSTALGAFNAAEWAAFQNLPVPIVFVCEDNGMGISVRTPGDWVESAFADRASLDYFSADGLDLADTWRVTRDAVRHCRSTRRPVFLHLKLIRLMGHAGTDMETEYLGHQVVEHNEARDPLLRSASLLMGTGVLSASEVLSRYESIRERARDAARDAAQGPRLTDLASVMRTLAPLDADAVHTEACRFDYQARRLEIYEGLERLPENGPPRHLALHLNRALHDLMIKYPEMTLFGEDVAQKGGVYTVTSGLARRFGGRRVFNTLLDETTILGMAQGAGYMSLLPVPEIQYLAYFHNACDQIRGEACSLQFFSDGQFSNPIVMRIASLGYQRGFGGHFHNDNSITALRDVPGLVIACPSRGDDAAMMLRSCMALARINGRVVAFLEPIALYMTKDLFEPQDGKWVFPYPAPDAAVAIGEPRVYRPEAEDLLIVTYGNGVLMSLRVANRLQEQHGAQVRILDLRWLKPLNAPEIVRHALETGKILIVDEGRRSGGVSEEIFTLLDESAAGSLPKRRVTGADSYIPLAEAANLVLVSEAEISAAAGELLAV